MTDEWDKDREVCEAATPEDQLLEKIWPVGSLAELATDDDVEFIMRARIRWPAALDRIQELEGRLKESRAMFCSEADRRDSMADRIEALEAENAELIKLLFVASDYLKQHWDMESAPLHKIAERLRQPDAQKLLRQDEVR